MENTATHQSNTDNFFVKTWNGDVPLVVTYWGIFLIPSVILDHLIPQELIENAIFSVCAIAYLVWSRKALWSSASKYTGPKHWAILSKIIVIINSILLTVAFVQGLLGN